MRHKLLTMSEKDLTQCQRKNDMFLFVLNVSNSRNNILLQMILWLAPCGDYYIKQQYIKQKL